MEQLLNALKTGQDGMAVGNPYEFLLILVSSMLFGLILRFVYYIYFRKNEPLDSSIARSFPLIAPGVTAIFWLIQYSLPLSLGLLGALSFVRFRTPVKRAEDIAFILIVIAVSLACAVLKIWVAILIVIIVLFYTFLRNIVLPRLQSTSHMALITLHTRDDLSANTILENLSTATGVTPRLVTMSAHDKIQSLVLQVPGSDSDLMEKIQIALKEMDNDSRFDVFYPGHQLGGY